MNDWLQHPAVQAGLAPFGVALPLSLLLARTRFMAAAVASGLVVLLVLTVGFALEPLTSVRKAIVVTLAATAVVVALEIAAVQRRTVVVAALASIVALSALWVLQRILEQQPVAAAWLLAAGAVLYVGLIAGGTLAFGRDPIRTAVMGSALGWGSGALAILGASALLGQIGLALGSASAAAALVQMLRGHAAPLGWTLGVPAAVGASFAGVLASATGELRWYALLPLLLVAPAVAWVPERSRPPWQQGLLCGLAGLLPVCLALALAWFTAASGS
jgi:hypothetical protein